MDQPPVPEKPSALKTGSRSVTIAWEVNGNVSLITHYTVFYTIAEEDDKNWHSLKTRGPTKEIQIDDLNPDTAYQFKVASNQDTKEYSPGPMSDIIRTKKIPSTLQKPRSKEVTHNSVLLTWSETGDTSPVTHYTIQYAVHGEDGSFTAKDPTWKDFDTKNKECNCIVENLLPNTCYRFRVSSNTSKGRYQLSPISQRVKTKEEPVRCQEVQTLLEPEISLQSETSSSNNVTKCPNEDPYQGRQKQSSFDSCYDQEVPTLLKRQISQPFETSNANSTTKSPNQDSGLELLQRSSSETDDQEQLTLLKPPISQPCEPSKANSTTTCSKQDLHHKHPNSATTSEDCGTKTKGLQTVASQMPPIPEKPICCGEVSHDSIPLSWKNNGNTVTPLVTHYTVTYKKASEKEQLMTFDTDSADTYCTVQDLDPNASYQFCIASNTVLGQSQPSENSDIIKTSVKMSSARPPVEIPPQTLKPFLKGVADHSCVPLAWQVLGDTNHVTHYTVTYKEVSKRTWIVHKTDNTDTSCIIDNLEPLTSYHFRVSSNTRKGSSQPSEKSDVICTYEQQKQTDLDQIPPQPQKPTAHAFGHSTMLLKWSVCENTAHITHYTVTYKIVNGNVSHMVETENADTSYMIEDLKPETPYQFQVASNTERWQSPPSEVSDTAHTQIKQKKTMVQDSGPPKPNSSKLTGISSHDSVPSRLEVPDRKADANNDAWIPEEARGADISYTIHAFEPRTSHQFRVASNTEHSANQPSEASDVMTRVGLHFVDFTPPKPNNLRVNGIPGHDSVSLSWDVQGNTTYITHYTVGYRAVGDKRSWSKIVTENTYPHYLVKGLQPETSYKFRVASNTEDKQSEFSEISVAIKTNSDSATALKPPKPNKPEVVDTPGHSSVKLYWTVPGNTSHVIHYIISYRRKSNAKKSTWMIVATKGNARSSTVEELEPETCYEFRVAANTQHEQSLPSEVSDAILTSEIPDSTINEMPPKPNPPRVDTTGCTSATLRWTVPGNPIHVTHYMLSYRKTCNDRWMVVETEGADCSYTIHDLEPGTSYQFRVASNTDQFQGPYSELSQPFEMPYILKPVKASKYVDVTHKQQIPSVARPQFSQSKRLGKSEDGDPIGQASLSAAQIYREDLRKKSERTICDSGVPLYQVPLIRTNRENFEKIQMLDLGISPALPKPEKVILVLGATGAGKSTLINGILNYITGVEWAEKSRFRLVKESATFAAQHKSQTKKISIYTLHHHDTFTIPYTLKIIDTPGFGDTDGTRKDKLITESIRNLFSSEFYGIDHIDAIGFVAQSSLPRLTPTQRYIFGSILSLFGKDIGDNIFLLLTFSDSQVPPVLASTKEARIPFKSYFKFNNSALFANCETEGNEFDQMFWKMGVKNYQKFLTELGNVEGKSLFLTNEALEERQQLEVCLEGIKQEIHKSLTKLEQLKVEIAVVKRHEADIVRNRNFEYTVDENKMVQVYLEEGQHVTNCLNCNRTCHFPCKIPHNENKDRCWAMEESGRCRICPSNCSWKLHRNDPYMIVVETVSVTKAADDLKRRYEKAKGEKMNAEKLTIKILEDFHTVRIKVVYMVTEVTRVLTRLKEIALRPEHLSTLDYLDVLIESERAEGHPGFLARIEQLEDVKVEARMLEHQMRVEGYDLFGKYRHKIKSIHDTPSFEEMAAEIRSKNPSTLNDLYKKFTNTHN